MEMVMSNKKLKQWNQSSSLKYYIDWLAINLRFFLHICMEFLKLKANRA